MATVQTKRLIPGAEIIEVGGGVATVQVGVPPMTVKLHAQQKRPPPTMYVLPDDFFSRGVVQVCLEFPLYFFLFVLGKAFGKLPPEAKLVVIGTADQLRRARRILEVTLFGFSPEEMRSWQGPETPESQRRTMGKKTVDFLRRCRAWFAPKQLGFADLKAFAQRVAEHRKANEAMPIGDYEVVFQLTNPHPLVRAFIDRYREEHGPDVMLTAYEFAFLSIEDAIEWRAFDPNGEATLAAVGDSTLGLQVVTIRRHGGNRFTVHAPGEEPVAVDATVTADQAPFLITLPPQPAAAEPGVFALHCLGSDSGFEVEHPTTGFVIDVNGQRVVVDTPVAASYLLKQQGIDPADVRVVIETHAHEDHMGSGIHFLLECVTVGRPFTYVAAEPVYRAAVAKIAAVLDVTEAEADRLLTRGSGDLAVAPQEGSRSRVIRVRPGQPIRLLGATWEFAWTVHPIPTTGFRVTLERNGDRHVLAFSSDTAPYAGMMGIDAMVAAGFLFSDEDPAQRLIRGDESVVLWEAGGTGGDPIHFRAQEWERIAAERNCSAPVVFMHAHPLPPDLRHHALARPGMRWELARETHGLSAGDVLAVHDALAFFDLRDHGYWLRAFTAQGEVERYLPGEAVVTEGEAADAWYLILRGGTTITVGGQPVGTIGSHGFFGELALLEDGQRKATVRAAGPLTVLRVPAPVFRDFVVGNELYAFFQRFWKDVGLLQSTRLFVGFAPVVVGELAKRAERRRYTAGEVLIRQGTTGRELFVIERGEVSVLRRGPDGTTEVIQGTRGPGEVIGEVGALIPSALRTATVRAETDVDALVLTDGMLADVVAGQISLELRLVALLKERGIAVPAATVS